MSLRVTRHPERSEAQTKERHKSIPHGDNISIISWGLLRAEEIPALAMTLYYFYLCVPHIPIRPMTFDPFRHISQRGL